MRHAEPPRVSTWLLERLASPHRRESLVGDLREQFQQGRSVWWYRRQVVGTILAGIAAELAADKGTAVRTLAIGWSATLLAYEFAFPLMERTRRLLFTNWGASLWGDSEFLRQLWVYYGVPFVLLTCLIFLAIGWVTASLHRHSAGALVIFLATMLIPSAINGFRTAQLLQTTLWPGWGWGSFRWALAYHVLLSLVLYPLCVLGAGLWALTRQRRFRQGDRWATPG
jgi:hypothetical protein